MSHASTDRLITRRRNGQRVGALQRRVRELRLGVCSARTCGQVGELKSKHAREATKAVTNAACRSLDDYRRDAPHVVSVLRAEGSVLGRIWFAMRFVFCGLSRERGRARDHSA